MQGAQVRSLVRELRSHMLQGQKTKFWLLEFKPSVDPGWQQEKRDEFSFPQRRPSRAQSWSRREEAVAKWLAPHSPRHTVWDGVSRSELSWWWQRRTFRPCFSSKNAWPFTQSPSGCYPWHWHSSQLLNNIAKAAHDTMAGKGGDFLLEGKRAPRKNNQANVFQKERQTDQLGASLFPSSPSPWCVCVC